MAPAHFPLLEIARDEVLAHVRDAKMHIRLASPFMSADVATLLVESARARGVNDRRMLTALTGRATSSGVLDPAALEILLDGRFAVASIPNLHAKVTLVDRRWGLVGSGNLTDAGLRGGNVELGVVLTGGQIRQAVAIFDRWWRNAKAVRYGDLPPYIEEFARQRRRGRGGRGLVHGHPLRVPRGRELERLHRERQRPAGATPYWLKTVYDRPDAAWRRHRRTWISDVHRIADDGRPLLRPGYQVGDRLVLYVAGPGGPRICPAIAEVTSLPEFDPDRVRDEADEESATRWAWVTEVEILHRVNVSAAPSLGDLGVRLASVRQKGRIRLSAATYRQALRRIARAGR